MSQIDQTYPHNTTRTTASGTEAACQFRLYSPQPDLQMVIISHRNLSSDPLVSHQLVDLANQAVKELRLNPSQVVWIEHLPAQGNNLIYANFYLIHFDWQAGQAISPHRSPIYEDWYLSWLENETYFH